MEDLGCFWAINMLVIERLHVLLKRMASGSRNTMQSFANHYDLWDTAQSEWRFEKKWSSEPKKSTLAGYTPMAEHDTITKALGAKQAGKLSRSMFLMVLELWATENNAFDKLLDRYKTAMAANRRARQQNNRARKTVLDFKDWVPKQSQRQLNAEEKAWTQTTHTVTVRFVTTS